MPPPPPDSPPARIRAGFIAGLGFTLDPFQVAAIDALDRGDNVVVAAPTGSGKTVVGEYAVARALAEGGKTFYTTPLKALSNQKYVDFVHRHGAGRVGLLTGDNAINGNAPVVVMTTEVLRNMIYADAPALQGLRYVVLDEVHYLQNAYRGPVWEEVIIHAPAGVDLVCLSATVSNAEELADWIRTVRGTTRAVIETRRPVALHDLYLVGDRSSDRLLLLPTLVDGRPNPEAEALEARSARHPSVGRRRGRLFAPRRQEVVELLDEQRMLPAIYFIFSRNACDDAVAGCLRDGLRLTSAEERSQIRAIVEDHTAGLGPPDLALLGHGSWLAGLEAGFGSHHAGLVPPFKEAVEACFSAGLVKVVFATETLSLGINMPARSVVIEKLTKFTGERHEFLTAGEYAQLTGRAGRRGIDEVGYAVVPWSPFVPFDQVAALAGERRYALTSSFRPTYNMAANLVARYRPDTAHHLLNLSFAQYRTDSDVVKLETRLEAAKAALAEQEARSHCDRGDTAEYRDLQRGAEDSRRARPAEVLAALDRIRPGDVLDLPTKRSARRVAVLSVSRRRGGEARLRAITPQRRLVALDARDFPKPPKSVGRVRLPQPYDPKSPAFQRRVASAIDQIDDAPALQDGAAALATAAARHPVAACPDAAAHLAALSRAERLGREVDRLQRQVVGRGDSLARQFDRVLKVLDRFGYVDGWALTPAGRVLAGLYHEADLLVAECLRRGLLDGLEPASLAALASVFTYEQRGQGDAAQARLPTAALRERWPAVDRLASELNDIEELEGLPRTRRPEPGFATVAYRWASGHDLSDVLADEEISGGDFVRNVKQLIDLLRQIGDLAPDPATAAAAGKAAELLFRGVVAASSGVTT